MARFKTPTISRKGQLAMALAALFALFSGLAAEAQRAGGWTAPGGRQGRTYEAGKFDYYVMSLSWSPSYCASAGGSASSDPQCRPRGGKRYSFVLHGLWPQFERGWPQDCQTADRGFVPKPAAQRMLDIMPSERLVFHEYRKHGTCSGLGIDGYFALSRKLHDTVKIPARYQNVTDPRFVVTPDEMLKDFTAANPGLTRDMMVVKCGGAGNRLEEVRVCFDREGKFRACGKNEDQKKACSAPRMYLPPVRG
jgi:ribonuclease T2